MSKKEIKEWTWLFWLFIGLVIYIGLVITYIIPAIIVTLFKLRVPMYFESFITIEILNGLMFGFIIYTLISYWKRD